MEGGLFAMQSAVSLLTMVFCATMIVRSNDNIQIFLPILTSVTAYWLPAPKLPAGALAGMGRVLRRVQQADNPSRTASLLTTPGTGPIGTPPDSIAITIHPEQQQMPPAPASPAKRRCQVPGRRDSGLPPLGITLQGAELTNC